MLGGAAANVTLEFPEGALTLTRLDKRRWPATADLPGYTRRDHMRYLLAVAPYLLPHVEHRPLTLIRHPDGVTGRRLVQFHWEARLPEFVETVDIWSERNERGEQYLLCNNVASLL